MRRYIQVFLLLIFVLAFWACIPVPVPVGPQDSGYNNQYGYDDYGDDYGYDDEYYDVPVTYGEPMYYAPPINVTFAFDYFTYEIVNGYVDIVFWRGGHRYHHEPWQERGKRISQNDIRSKDFHHRIRGSELYQHRKKLREKNNISHPDTYYGVKPPSKLQRDKQRQLRDRQQQEQEKQKRLIEKQQEQEQQRQKRSIEQQQRDQEKQRILIEKQQEQERQRNLLQLQQQEQEGKRRYIEMQKQEREDRRRSLDQQQQQQDKLKQKGERQKRDQEKREQKDKEKKKKDRLKKEEKGKVDEDAIHRQRPAIY